MPIILRRKLMPRIFDTIKQKLKPSDSETQADKKSVNLTDYHAKYFAYELTKRCASDSLEKLSSLELYGLVSVIDDQLFGDLKGFKAKYARVPHAQDIHDSEVGLVEPKQEMFTDLRNRLKPVCTRTLRRQVLEYIKYTKRIPLTQDYIPTKQEIELYNGMSEYLQRTELFALPSSQRQLMTLILRKLLASSSFAIASTLSKTADLRAALIDHFKLENFDAEVHEKLKLNIKESQSFLHRYERWLWDTTRYFLGDNADFSNTEYSFMLKKNPFPGETIHPGPYRIGKNIEDAHIYRPGHPLAQRILNEVKQRRVDESEIVFDYSNNPTIISVLKPFVGKSGVMKVSNYTIEAFESEDHVIVSAFDHKGKPIPSDISKKLFYLSAAVSHLKTEIPENEKRKLDKLEQESINTIITRTSERNSAFFETEVEKLDKWADDKRLALKTELKEYDDQIVILKKEARVAANLPEKLAAQKKIRDLDTKRNTAWKEYDKTAKVIEQQKDKLLDKVEKRLNQTLEKKTIFTISWKLI